jgi:glycosyltransferase involved in cell wall biosynthesis
MKILLVHNKYQQAGGEDVVFDQELRLLERHGHHVVSYLRSNHELEELSPIEQIGLVGRIISAEDSKEDIQQILREEKPDLVHAHNTFMMISPSIYEVCKQEGVPVLQTLHNFRLLCPAGTFFRDGHVCEECRNHGLMRSVAHGCYRESRAATAAVALMLQVHRTRRTWDELVSGFIALTHFARDKFIECGLPAEKIYVKPNFVYPDPGQRSTAAHYALFAGRLSPEKGVSTLLAAWDRVRSPIPLVIVGDGPLRSELEAEAAKRNLWQVTFRGHLALSETRAAIKQAAFLIVPSLWYEGFSLNVAEAFACGVPVICSRLGALQENVADHRTGLHFDVGDAEDLAAKVEWARTHPFELATMGREARHEYERRFSSEVNYSRLMEIYEQMVGAYA